MVGFSKQLTSYRGAFSGYKAGISQRIATERVKIARTGTQKEGEGEPSGTEEGQTARLPTHEHLISPICVGDSQNQRTWERLYSMN